MLFFILDKEGLWGLRAVESLEVGERGAVVR